MPPTPQPSTPRPLIIVVCESVPTSVSGYSAPVVVEHDAREVLEVDLVDDAGVRRHGLEALERGLAPAQERVALLVALELLLGVDPERLGGAERVDLHRVVDHELDGHERVDRRRVAAHVGHRVAHRGEVDDARHAGEVLQDHARGRERDLLGRLGLGVPGGERLDVLAADADAVLVAQQVLEQHLQRERQPRHVVGRLQRLEAIDLVGAPADLELGARVEGVLRVMDPSVRRHPFPSSPYSASQWTSDGIAARAGHLEHPEVLAQHGDRDVVDRHLAEPARERAGVRVAVQHEVGVVLAQRRGEPVGAEERPDVGALALERRR